LAQEARGAAKVLRQDVTLLTQPPPADPMITTMPDLRVETSLNVLDDAIGLLSELDAPGSSSKVRRGRIDLATLLMELVPTASVSIEPGAGVEVFGEESELRRMLNVLISQTNTPGGALSSTATRIRRENEWVKIDVDLGPDVSASTELERRWLSRMAVRMGGRLELERGTMALTLPADASVDQNEVSDLRKELEQAQQLGEAYARELASVFVVAEQPSAARVSDDRDVMLRRFELLVGFASALRHTLEPVFRGLNEVADRLDASHSGGIVALLSNGHDVLAELARIAGCEAPEASAEFDVARSLRDALGHSDAQAARHGVRFDVDAPRELFRTTKPKALAVLFRTLIDHAITATPRGGKVALSLGNDGAAAWWLRLRDGGPVVPTRTHAELLEHRIDPSGLGRPPGPSLLVAHTVIGYLGGTLTLGESPDGGAVTEARFQNAG
jgi:signal transduction histidine kinase